MKLRWKLRSIYKNFFVVKNEKTLQYYEPNIFLNDDGLQVVGEGKWIDVPVENDTEK